MKPKDCKESHTCSVPGFSLRKTLECGQVFRYSIYENYYLVQSADKIVLIEEQAKELVFYCSSDDMVYWQKYFDFDSSYSEMVLDMNIQESDVFVRQCIHAGWGIHILNQNLWEVFVSFIISQNNNIPRIKQIVETLCRTFGTPINYYGREYYAFPTVNQLYAQLDRIYDCGLGYRVEYIRKLVFEVVEHGVNLSMFSGWGYSGCMELLQSYPGIGPKVASCIALFGYHMLESFPIDTWIQKCIRRYNIKPEVYGKYRGLLQQYMFYYQRSLGDA